jgi:glyoxylase-like metal-dependent hydrolase (beta-lactamase superfamily II)
MAKINDLGETVVTARRNVYRLLARVVAILVLTVTFLTIYLLRGGFSRFEISSRPVPPPAFTNWHDVLEHPRDISVTTVRTGVIHMDACLNLDPASPRQGDCDHVPRDLAVLVHWVHHPRFGDFLIDSGFDDAFAKHPPYGNYTEAMKLFNWVNGVTNRQEPGADLSAQLARRNVHPKGVFFTHLHPDHTGGVPALEPQTEFVFGKNELSFLARAGVANHFSGKSKFSIIDFSLAPVMAPLGASVDLFGDGSFWAISVPGHTDDDVAYLVNGATPVLFTGDASHFGWALNNGVAPRGWNKAGTARGYASLEQLRAFAKAYPNVKIIYGHQAEPSNDH